ncbi:MAG: NAD(P)H-binding protein [Nitrospiraceae bacterium]|nr:NAD(P)H-binding protein [Nitrospiraceae bacterium]
MNIFIAGGTGFVGGHLIDALIELNHKLRCLVRSEKAQNSFKQKGIEVVVGDITMPETIRNALNGIDLVIHLVGIIHETDSSTFRKIHVYGTENLISESKNSGVKHFFYQSAIGADIDSWSGYLRTKAETEEIVKASGIRFTILRPSILIGPWDGFTRKIINIIKKSPIIPIPGSGKSKFQPLYINDWVKCALKIIDSPEAYSGTFEIGGPQHLTYDEILNNLLIALNVKKPVFHVPMGLMKLGAFFAEKILSVPPVTIEQLGLLEKDNLCPIDSVEKSFGFKPLKYEDALKTFINQK